MIDYKLLHALAKVVEEGGFEKAARALFLTQSAVSQRIRQLEDYCGQQLLTRTTPPQPTPAGKALLKHYHQVRMLEADLATELKGVGADRLQQLAIGINADSLDYWFLSAVAPLLRDENILFDLKVADQDETHRYLREGEVIGCISAEAKALQGCRVESLGQMHYRLLATPEFAGRWFADGLTAEALSRAPAVIFNRSDRLQHQFVERYVTTEPLQYLAHYVPAPLQFLQMILGGFCYGMLPDWQSREHVERGTLKELIPRAKISIDLFWHCWNLGAEPLERLTACLLQGASANL